jgi:hypothetical protein
VTGRVLRQPGAVGVDEISHPITDSSIAGCDPSLGRETAGFIDSAPKARTKIEE